MALFKNSIIFLSFNVHISFSVLIFDHFLSLSQVKINFEKSNDLLPAKESQQHLPVLTTLQSQDTRVFGNRIFMISAFTQTATVTHMIPR